MSAAYACLLMRAADRSDACTCRVLVIRAHVYPSPWSDDRVLELGNAHAAMFGTDVYHQALHFVSGDASLHACLARTSVRPCTAHTGQSNAVSPTTSASLHVSSLLLTPLLTILPIQLFDSNNPTPRFIALTLASIQRLFQSPSHSPQRSHELRQQGLLRPPTPTLLPTSHEPPATSLPADAAAGLRLRPAPGVSGCVS